MGEITYRIEQDEDPQDPRRGWDHVGQMVCFHKRYDLGDKHEYSESSYSSWSELAADFPPGSVVLPLYLMDHSGISMRTSSHEFQQCDSAGWDWGQVGFIFATPDKIRENWNAYRITQKLREKVIQSLVAEVAEYDQYLTGDVYGYIVETEVKNEFNDGTHMETLDSCWGFHGYEYAEEEAKSLVQHHRMEREGARA